MKKLLLISAVVLLLVACNLSGLINRFVPDASETPEPEVETAEPRLTENPISETPTFTPPATDSSDVNEPLYSDDFSDIKTGWVNTTIYEHPAYYYQGGRYIIQADPDEYYFYVTDEQTYANAVYSIEVTHLAGDESLTGGLVFWNYQDAQNYLALTVSANGTYSIHRFLNGAYGMLALPTAFSGLKPGRETNKVTIATHGIKSDIYFNDQFAYRLIQPQYQKGSLGMGAYPDVTSNVEVAFDNMAVYKYQPGSAYTPAEPSITPTPQYRSITWSELTQFLAGDYTNMNPYDAENYNCLDFAIDLTSNARAQNINAVIVGVDFEDQETGHAFVKFETSDKGVIFVEPQGDNPYQNVEIGVNLCDYWGRAECMGIITHIEYYGACNHQQQCTLAE